MKSEVATCSGTVAFDGQNVIVGGQGIYWSGALRLVKGDGGFIGGYDSNGNLTSRVVDGAATLLSYDAENRLIDVGGAATTSFVYNGDGNRVKGTNGGTTTTYIGNYVEWISGTPNKLIKYYYADATRVAMNNAGTLNYLLGDHLGSTAITTDNNGGKSAEIRYYPWGTERYTNGTTPTTYHFTGQRLENGIGLYYYGARWYDPSAGRFVQADTIIPNPGNSQAWDRYAYSYSNPIKYTDPTGYFSEDQIKDFFGFEEDNPWGEVLKLFQKGGKYEGRWGWLETLRRAEVGDQITVDWMEGVSSNGDSLPESLTFDIGGNGNLILKGNGIYFNAEIAGIFGKNFTLSHYTDLSELLCSPGKCGYTTEFSTAARHEPYLHSKVKWGEFGNVGKNMELLEFLSATSVTGAMTGIMGAAIGLACTNPTSPAACPASITFLGPAFYGGVWSPWMIGTSTYEYFINEYIENTP